MRLIFRFRPVKFFLFRNWYSAARWNRKYYFGDYEGEQYRLIDLGAITIGYAKKLEK